jgi:signal peptidase I
MFNIFLPARLRKALSEAEVISGNLNRYRAERQDLLKRADLATLKDLETRYAAAIKARDAETLEALNLETINVSKRIFPPSPWDGWRENVEVFVVAAIIALAIRTFFLQPFKIPTGSMEPTLLGIEPKVSTELPPSIPYQIYDFLIHGRSYSRVVTKQGGRIVGLTTGTMTIWFEYTDVTLQDANNNLETDRIWIRASDVETKLHILPYKDRYGNIVQDKLYQPGDVLANYVTQTGDQVLVDKVTYNFHPPRRGDVFIFKTAGIPSLANELGPDQEGSEDFIKRCVGFGGDIIKVKPPMLYINGNPATGAPSFAKEFTQTDNYPGYTLVGGIDGTGYSDDNGVSQTYVVPDNCYWAMGDNSPNSKDSRYWGGVPKQNLVGRGAFVWWPFTERWGFIR